MNFDHLDFPTGFDAPDGGLDDVEKRAGKIRVRHRLAAGGTAVLALGLLVGAGNALTADPDTITAEPGKSTSTIAEATTTTSVADPATVVTTPDGAVVPPVPGDGDSDPGTDPGRDGGGDPATHPGTPGSGDAGDPADWSNLAVTWDQPSVSVVSGARTTIGYTVKNNGAFAVEIPDANCTDDLLDTIAVGTVWPVPTAGSAYQCAASGTITLAAGASKHYADEYFAGTKVAGGYEHPIAPGARSFTAKPWQLVGRAGSTITVTVTAPATVPFELQYSRSQLRADSGNWQDIRTTYSHALPYDVKVWLAGICPFDQSKFGSVSCLNNGLELTVPADPPTGGQTSEWVHMRAHARAGFVSGGTPLPSGSEHAFPVGATTLTFFVD